MRDSRFQPTMPRTSGYYVQCATSNGRCETFGSGELPLRQSEAYARLGALGRRLDALGNSIAIGIDEIAIQIDEEALSVRLDNRL